MFHSIDHCRVIISIVSGGGGNNNNQNYPAAGGYGVDSHTTGGAKEQLLTLIRSVRTVMRGKPSSCLLHRSKISFFLVPLIAFNIVTIILLILFG